MRRTHQLVVAAAALLALAMSLFSYVRERDERLDQWHRMLERRADSRVRLLAYWTQRHEDGLRFLAELPAPPTAGPVPASRDAAVTAELDRASRILQYLGLYLVGGDGSVRYASPNAPRLPQRVLAVAGNAAQTGQFRAEIGDLAGEPVVTLVLPRRSPGDATSAPWVSGVLVAIVPAEELRPILQAAAAPVGSETITIVHPSLDRPGRLAVLSTDGDGLRLAEVGTSSGTAPYALERSPLGGARVDEAGEPALEASRLVAATGWGVVARVSYRAAMSGVPREIALRTLPLLLGVLLLSAWLRVLQRRAQSDSLESRLHAERRLRASEMQRNAILENIPDLAWLKDRDSRFIAVNTALAASVDRVPQDLVGKTDSDFFDAGIAERYCADDRAVMATGTLRRVVEPFAAPGAEARLIETIKAPLRDESGDIVGTAGIARDVTERTRIEEALHRTKDTLTALFAASPVAIIAYDNDGKITVWNPAATALFGWSDAEVLGRLTPLIPPEDRVRIESVRRATAQGHVTSYEAPRLHKSGRRLDVQITVGPLHGPGGAVAGFIGVVQDVTERRRAEALIQQAQKLESLGVLAGGVAHDFNNLLAAVLGHAQLALGKTPAASPVHRHLKQLIDAGERATDISLKMLAVSSHGHFDRRARDAAEVLRGVVPALEARLAPGIRLQLELGEVPRAALDAGQIAQALEHLVDNAVEAMNGGEGTITLSARPARLDATDVRFWSHTGAVLPAGDYLAIEVRDPGHGIPEPDQQRMFDPFFSTRFTGRGLGLAVVLGIVRGHRGGIAVKSAPGRGTTVTLVFPAEAEVPVPR